MIAPNLHHAQFVGERQRRRAEHDNLVAQAANRHGGPVCKGPQHALAHLGNDGLQQRLTEARHAACQHDSRRVERGHKRGYGLAEVLTYLLLQAVVFVKPLQEVV